MADVSDATDAAGMAGVYDMAAVADEVVADVVSDGACPTGGLPPPLPAALICSEVRRG